MSEHEKLSQGNTQDKIGDQILIFSRQNQANQKSPSSHFFQGKASSLSNTQNEMSKKLHQSSEKSVFQETK